MNQHLSAFLKGEYQRNYRRFEDHYTRGEMANQALKQAKASRIWVMGVIAMLFSMHSDFFLGAAFALLGAYFYQIISAYIRKVQAEDGAEELTRWFSANGLVMQDKTAFFKGDDQRENPVDLYQDAVYQ